MTIWGLLARQHMAHLLPTKRMIGLQCLVTYRTVGAGSPSAWFDLPGVNACQCMTVTGACHWVGTQQHASGIAQVQTTTRWHCLIPSLPHLQTRGLAFRLLLMMGPMITQPTVCIYIYSTQAQQPLRFVLAAAMGFMVNALAYIVIQVCPCVLHSRCLQHLCCWLTLHPAGAFMAYGLGVPWCGD